jgi:hypothetical protein
LDVISGPSRFSIHSLLFLLLSNLDAEFFVKLLIFRLLRDPF